jgi:aryl-alcohol dehydrogenase-like predicted oxidoreductase
MIEESRHELHAGGPLVQRVDNLPAGRRSRLRPASGGFTPEGLARTAPLVEELRKIRRSHGVSVPQVALARVVT